ncbi:MAG TPA: heme-binding protein [Candidatus Aquabacterium excrementipullorum]|nr:heme-binding protein [Candidatus Aquabacterium excrementipullorum]
MTASLNLAAANRLIDAALAHGRAGRMAPLCVAVLDAGGHVIALQREDGASILRPQIATAKARGSLGLGFGGRELARRAAANPAFIGALASLAGGDMLPVPGGVLVRTAEGALIGAVGISGDLSDKDEACAIAGIVSVGLVADVGVQELHTEAPPAA